MEFHLKAQQTKQENGIKSVIRVQSYFFNSILLYIEFILKDLKYERYEQSHFTFNIQYFNNNQYGTKKIKQTAGRDQLGTFAPKFAELNDDILLEKCGAAPSNSVFVTAV